jgi:hypothetical protein
MKGEQPMNKPSGRTTKTETLPSIAVTPRIKEAVEKRALELDMSVSEYLRRLIEKDLKVGGEL